MPTLARRSIKAEKLFARNFKMMTRKPQARPVASLFEVLLRLSSLS
jgi:hypothetical protein